MILRGRTRSTAMLRLARRFSGIKILILYIQERMATHSPRRRRPPGCPRNTHVRCLSRDQLGARHSISMDAQSSCINIGDSSGNAVTMDLDRTGRWAGAAVLVSPVRTADTRPKPCAAVCAPTGLSKWKGATRGRRSPRAAYRQRRLRLSLVSSDWRLCRYCRGIRGPIIPRPILPAIKEA